MWDFVTGALETNAPCLSALNGLSSAACIPTSGPSSADTAKRQELGSPQTRACRLPSPGLPFFFSYLLDALLPCSSLQQWPLPDQGLVILSDPQGDCTVKSHVRLPCKTPTLGLCTPALLPTHASESKAQGRPTWALGPRVPVTCTVGSPPSYRHLAETLPLRPPPARPDHLLSSQVWDPGLPSPCLGSSTSSERLSSLKYQPVPPAQESGKRSLPTNKEWRAPTPPHHAPANQNYS